MKLQKGLFTWSIVLSGVLFSLYLQLQIPDGVYFSGDAGLKALLSQQLSSGIFRFDIMPPSDNWIKHLWQSGLYPYAPPFVYDVNNKYFITFPFTFPLVTAPFNFLFGYRGLYLIPLVSTWIIWLAFYRNCRCLSLKNSAINIALIVLIFASPLTIYSAMYWEHTLAVVLCFTGMSLYFIHGNYLKYSHHNNIYTDRANLVAQKLKSILSGFLIGLAVWFRPEFLCMVCILLIVVYAPLLLSKIKSKAIINIVKKSHIYFHKNRELFVVSQVATIGLFFLCNKLIYNHPLGIHAIQIVEKLSPTQRLIDAWHNLAGMSQAILAYFPVIYFPIIYFILALVILIQKRQSIAKPLNINFQIVTVYLICLLFMIGVALLVPIGTAGLIAGGKQWGPRFLLILVPIICLLIAKQISSLQSDQILNYLSLGLISILLLLGIQKNTYQAIQYWQKNNQDIAPAVEFLTSDRHRFVAISHQFVGQALEPPVTKQKVFFKVENSQDLFRLSTALIEQKQPKFIYICYPHSLCPVVQEKPEKLQFVLNRQKWQIKLSKLGKFGKYPIYQGNIIEY